MNFKRLLMLLAFASLGACATLPSSGPSGSQILETAREASTGTAGLNIEVVEVDTLAALPVAAAPAEWTLADLGAPPPSDTIGFGDVLSINVFEAGVSLFGSSSSSGSSSASGVVSPGFDLAVRMNTLPLARVDDQGEILVPYVGRLRVVGRTVMEVQEQMRRSLRNFSQDPQVLVNREQVIGNTVIVGGEVAEPGRLVLQTNRESLADIIALSGGYRGEARNLVLRVERGGDDAFLRLGQVMEGAYNDLTVYPGDRLTVLTDPLMYSVLGASGRVQQMPFSRDAMNLVEAISAVGGPSENSGDPAAIFVFRYEGPDRTRPVVYHFNMTQAPTFFLAQQFALNDGDILYFGNAAANQPSKMIQLISQLFSPVVTAISVTNTLTD